MKALIFLALFLNTSSVYSQKIISDKTDAFTNKRTIVSTDLPIYGSSLMTIVSVSGYIEKSNEKTEFFLGFWSQNVGVSISGSDTVTKQCLLKLENGKIIPGTWVSTTSAIGKLISIFKIKTEDIEELTTLKVTDIKIVGDKNHMLQFEVTKKNQENISKIVTRLNKEIL